MFNVQAELMLFGLMSLLMGHWIVFVAKICVKSSSWALSSRFFPCVLEEEINVIQHVLFSSPEYLNQSVSKVQVKPGSHEYCPKVCSLLVHALLILDLNFLQSNTICFSN